MKSLTEHQRYHLKKFINELSSYSARHTEFVSVYIPQGYNLNKIISQLKEEQATATNIKSPGTRKNVNDALEKMLQHLKLYSKTPLNGLAVFAGNIASQEGKSDVRAWSIEPPVPLQIKIYRCDKNFKLDILVEVFEIKEFYGLVVVDSRDAILALLKGKTIIPLTKTHSHVPGKMKAGGQSSKRFQSNRDLAVKEHLKKVADYMKDHFMRIKELKGIIIGGPGPIKFDLIEKDFLTGDVQKKIKGTKDLSYTGEFGLEELVDKSQDILQEEEIAKEKEIVNDFLELLAKRPGLSLTKEDKVKKALEMGAVGTLLLSESIDEKKIDALETIAKQFSTEIRIISTETREGVQLKHLGGVVAILRYETG